MFRFNVLTRTQLRMILPFAILSLLIYSVLAFAPFSNTKIVHAASTSTNQFKGVNWADPGDNFQSGVIYPSGLSSSDTYASASTVADRIIGQLYSLTGANTVRMPINEATVSNYWGTYTGAIDTALGKGNVILAYWAYSGGKPANMTDFWNMWDTVINKYGGNTNAYFEIINEPYGYNSTDLDNLYNDWLTRYPNVPRGHIILDGTGYAQNVTPVGSDSRLDQTLLAVHDYSFFVSPPYEDETQWYNHLGNEIGSYASRTIMTEWGAAMNSYTKNGISYNKVDYSIPSGSYWADYVRGISSKLHDLGVGSVYWPGLRDGDPYSLTTKSGSGSSIVLSLVNASGLTRLQYAWGIGNGGTTTVRIKNANTGLYIDGMGRTANGSNAGQWSNSTSTNQEWIIENDGDYVRFKNVATGLYLDGLGSTSNGSVAGQWSDSNSTNQQWSVLTDVNNVRIQNRGTGLYLDGMGRTANGADLAQYNDSNSTNQQWQIVH